MLEIHPMDRKTRIVDEMIAKVLANGINDMIDASKMTEMLGKFQRTLEDLKDIQYGYAVTVSFEIIQLLIDEVHKCCLTKDDKKVPELFLLTVSTALAEFMI